MSSIITEEDKQFIIKNYANMSNADIAAKFGVSEACIKRWAGILGLKKTEEHRLQQRMDALGKIKNHWTKDMEKRRKMSETIRGLYVAERRRVLFGLPQKTRLKVVRVEPKIQQRRYLKDRGYILDEYMRIAYWTKRTNRCPRLEANGSKYYKFRRYEEND